MFSAHLDDYAQYVINDRLAAAHQAELAAQLPKAAHRSFAIAARTRLASGLRSLAAHLDAGAPAEPRLLIARSRFN